jgi:hypothetical protein
MLTLEVRDVTDVRRGHLKHMTAAEVEEEDRKFKASKAKAEEKQGKPPAKLKFTLPADPEAAAAVKGIDVKLTTGRFEFAVPAGSGKALVEQWRKNFPDKSWKEEVPTWEDAAGSLVYSKEGRQITITYVDPGLIPAQISITADGVELEWDAPK